MRDGTLGYMLQGVSQQPQRVQPVGHVVKQLNGWPDPNKGLTSRPSTDFKFKFPHAGSKKQTIRVAGRKICFSYESGVLRAYDYNGTNYTILDPETRIGYIGDRMAFSAVDGKVMAVNRDIVVATTTASTTVFTNWGFVFCLNGEFSRIYTVVLKYTDGTTATGTYTTPDGTATGDAAKTQGTFILNQIITGLNAGKKASTSITVARGHMYIRDTSWTISVNTEDQAGNTLMRGGWAKTDSFENVPAYAAHDAVIRVTGQTGTLDDEVYLKFVSETTTAPGSGFGDPGQWVETGQPGGAQAFDLNTMPHVIELTSPTVLTLKKYAWEPRRVGAVETAPFPSFVGKTINDIGEFQRRLWVLSGKSFISTRTNNYDDFFRKTATATLASDPVDISPDGEDDVTMFYGVAYDTNLILFSDKGQFLISGSPGLSFSNSDMVRTTNFEMSPDVKPVVAGQTVLMPYKQKRYSGVNEMFPTDDLATNTIESITKAIPRYIDGMILGLAVEANAKVALAHTDTTPNLVYVYNFLWENNTKVQSAWHIWEMPHEVLHIYVADGVVYMWTLVGSDAYLCELKPDRPDDEDLSYHVTLDYKVAKTGPSFLLPENDYILVTRTAGDDYPAGVRVTPVSIVAEAGQFRYTLPPGTDENVYAGKYFTFEVIPRKPYIARFNEDTVDTTKRIVIHKFVVDYVDSGEFEALMDCMYRDGVVSIIKRENFPVSDDPTDTFETTVSSGSFEIPWGEDNFIADLVLRARSFLPTTYVEIHWWGQVYKGPKQHA